MAMLSIALCFSSLPDPISSSCYQLSHSINAIDLLLSCIIHDRWYDTTTSLLATRASHVKPHVLTVCHTVGHAAPCKFVNEAERSAVTAVA
jgi:hypothetical protein